MSAGHRSFASVSPCRTRARDGRGEGGLDAAGALLPVGWHCRPCWDRMPGPSHCHLLHLSTAQGPSLRQETIAFPSASPTLGKLPRQPAEEISGASHAGTEPTLLRAVPERLGFAAWRPTRPWLGASPPQRQAPCVGCAHGAACRGSRGVGDQGTLDGEGGQPGSRAPWGWSSQRDGKAAWGLSACRDGVHPSCRSHAG